jgi:hypothetical protein
MERGLLAELSPHERTTLLRIANGDSRGRTLHPGHIKRLVSLALIEDDGPFYQLTALGEQRCGMRPPCDGRQNGGCPHILCGCRLALAETGA